MSSEKFIDKIKTELNTKTFGHEDIVYCKNIDSTNIKAQNLARTGYKEGTIVIADNQTKGKGRKGRHWFSPPGAGIYMSMILKPEIEPSEAHKITLITAVAAAEAINRLTGIDTEIKWPNDILVKNKKIAGILSEINISADSIKYIIVGIGINVNTTGISLHDDIKDIATSISIETGKIFSRTDIIKRLLESFEYYYELFLNNGFSEILAKWKSLAKIIGKKVKADLIKGSITGEVIDIDKEGFLIIKSSVGMIEKIVAGDISFLE